MPPLLLALFLLTCFNAGSAIMFVLITGNKEKIREFNAVLKGKIDFETLNAEKPEIQSEDISEIAKTAAKFCADRIGKPVVVEDSALAIEALGGFPGPYTRYIYERIGNTGLVKLMEGAKNRKCWYKSAIGYCEPGRDALCFWGEEEGKIAGKEKGKTGWGQDRIFIPLGSSRTYAETRKPGSVNEFRRRAIEKLATHLKGK